MTTDELPGLLADARLELQIARPADTCTLRDTGRARVGRLDRAVTDMERVQSARVARLRERESQSAAGGRGTGDKAPR